ncbi:hypothetical protein CTKA_00923 [Chthonomonas calidirosea]|uniref:DUF5658 domain-containing protein n=2 Tax=Chthonomonas TaxID=1077265 RepID=S0ES99_CHTCT|nr:hypothetical protein CCALI_00234 [Chthonomonas calidirosea T49]CEK15836.1 hypothetical protein CTKA_00923 [Chthonomonas calidirosea]
MALIGLADLGSTILFIERHGAQEANPIFRHFWEMGLGAFIVAKLVCLIGPLLVMEWARQRHPLFVTGALRIAIVGYLALYGVGVLHLNHTAKADIPLAANDPSALQLDYLSQQMAIKVQMIAQRAHKTRFARPPQPADAEFCLRPAPPIVRGRTPFLR